MASTVSAGEQTLKVVAWASLFAGLGAFTGNLVDQIIGEAIAKQTTNNFARAIGQFAPGVAILGSMVDFVIPASVQSPVSDGLLFYFFLSSQPKLAAAVGALLQDFNKSWFPAMNPSRAHPTLRQAVAAEKDAMMPGRPAVSAPAVSEEQLPPIAPGVYQPMSVADPRLPSLPAQPF